MASRVRGTTRQGFIRANHSGLDDQRGCKWVSTQRSQLGQVDFTEQEADSIASRNRVQRISKNGWFNISSWVPPIGTSVTSLHRTFHPLSAGDASSFDRNKVSGTAIGSKCSRRSDSVRREPEGRKVSGTSPSEAASPTEVLTEESSMSKASAAAATLPTEVLAQQKD